MQITIKQIEGLVAENQAITEGRTPFLDMALGGLRTAAENLREHVAAAIRLKAAAVVAPEGSATEANKGNEVKPRASSKDILPPGPAAN